MDTRIVRRQGVIAERLLDETVVLDPDSDAYARLNATGRWVWERLAAPQTLDSLARMLAAEFDIDAPRARADVAGFVRGLLERGLVEVSG
jgi:Coenzyme PQQ synthesis protein D (PqqD)